jgi:hypothetical protein
MARLALAAGFAALILTASCAAGPPSATQQPAGSGFSVSFAAGPAIGGTEMRVLAAHGGHLYAGNGYWEDREAAGRRPGAQILVLDRPGGAWRVDHTFDAPLPTGRPRDLAVSALRDVTFRNDADGQPLPAPVSLLAASTWDLTGARRVVTRDDATGDWTGVTIAQDPPRPHFLPQIRSLGFHRDALTGRDRIFAGDHRGIFSGGYDPTVPGRIRWDPAPELDVSTLSADAFPGLEGRLRISSFAQANGVLYAAVGQKVFARTDGAAPSWRPIYTNPHPYNSQTGLRGLTTIPDPSGAGEVLLAAVEGKNARVVRIDPRDGADATDLDLGGFLDRAWSTRVSYVIAAYNDMTPVPDPRGGQGLLIGLEAFIPSAAPRPPGHQVLPVIGGLEAGAWYLFRDADGHYDLHRIDAALPSIGSALVATRAIAVSPFPGDSDGVYFAGYDANNTATHDSAWIVRTPLPVALGLQVRQ